MKLLHRAGRVAVAAMVLAGTVACQTLHEPGWEYRTGDCAEFQSVDLRKLTTAGKVLVIVGDLALASSSAVARADARCRNPRAR